MSVLDRRALMSALRDGVTVVTPNRRLARELKREFDDLQLASARHSAVPAVWSAAEVLPWSAWLAGAFADACMARPEAGDGPDLLSPLQQRALWESVIEAAGALPLLRHPAAIAESAAAAWDLLHAHAELPVLARAAMNDDHTAFAGWAREFARRLRDLGAITDAQLPDWLAQALADGRWRPARAVLFAGFDAITPAQQRLLAALREAGSVAEPVAVLPTVAGTVAIRVAFGDPRSQWAHAAAWARARLQANPSARIGIVVPDLGAQRAAIVDALTDALAPRRRLAPEARDAAATAPPFNVSLGEALSAQPLVATALALLDLAVGPVEIARIGHLLRSPYLAEGEQGGAEWARRARLDRRLRDDGVWELDLDGLRRAAGRLDDGGEPLADSAPRLARALGAMQQRLQRGAGGGAQRRGPRLPLSSAIALMADLLRDAGFPGTRPLDSVDYQAHARWRELLTSLGGLDALLGPLDLAQAVAQLRRVVADTVFQPEGDAVPVQVLGVIESSHLAFDHLWIANATDDRWPPEAQPNPLLPLALQRGWGEPSSSAELALARAERHMAQWQSSAAEVVFTYPLHDGDRPLAPSPLIAALPLQPASALPAPAAAVAQRLKRTLSLDPIVDETAPPLAADAPQRGGTGLFTDQSACGFRAFATQRLHALPLSSPQPGLDAALRGQLLHRALHAFWQGLDSQQALRALDDGALHARVVASAGLAVAELLKKQPSIMGPQMQSLECERLERAVHAWLDIEDQRPPFSVITTEADREAVIGGLRVAVRPDRVDRLEDGRLVIVDYKTGRCSIGQWLDPRPEAPQLPLYATAFTRDGERVAGIAFAQLKPGETRAHAVGDVDTLFPQATVIADDEVRISRPGWNGLQQDWAALLEQLAAEFIAGAAAVAPRSPAACTWCALPLLCRVGERSSLATRLAGADNVEVRDE